ARGGMTSAATMPRIVIACALVGGCVFRADYRSGEVHCSDGKCPSGLICRTEVCVDPRIDAAVDAPPDVPDAKPALLTCTEPGPFPATGGTATGSTATRTSMMSSMCGGFVMNGPDAVYRIDVGAGAHINLSIDNLNAYVIVPCTPSPGTPMCIGNM